MATPQAITLTVSTCTLDQQCKATLQTMLNHGWTKAHTAYTTTQRVVSLAELSHLLTRGGLALQSTPLSTLKKYSAPKFGPGVGVEVAFELNVNLA